MRNRFENMQGCGPRQGFGREGFGGQDFGGRGRGEFFGGHGPQHRPGGPGGFGPFGGRGNWGGGRGHRARPGNLRVAILALLAEEPLNGYGIIQAISARSDGLWQPSSGAVYPALQLLEDEGLITATEAAGKRAYTLSDAGKTYVQEHADEVAKAFKAADESGEGLRDLMGELASLLGAVKQVARVGSAEQRKAAQEAVTTARKALYKLLAED